MVGENQHDYDERPWTDRELMRELYVEKERPMRDIAAEFGISDSTINNWVQRFGLERHTPWRDEDTLRELYHDKGLSTYQIADALGCVEGAVYRWMVKHDIPRRTPLPERPKSIRTGRRGYTYWYGYNEEGNTVRVRMHRLLAASESGFDAVKGKVVHHKNKIPWDNRPSNIEIMESSEHTRLHANERWGNDTD